MNHDGVHDGGLFEVHFNEQGSRPCAVCTSSRKHFPWFAFSSLEGSSSAQRYGSKGSLNPTLVLAVVGFAAPGFDSLHTWPFLKDQRNSGQSKQSPFFGFPLPHPMSLQGFQGSQVALCSPLLPRCIRACNRLLPPNKILCQERERVLYSDWIRKGGGGEE